MRVLSAFANQLCAMISEVEPEQRAKELRKVSARFAENIGLSEQALRESMEKSFTQVAQFAGIIGIIGISLKQSAFGNRLRLWNAKPGAAAAERQALEETDESAETVLSAVVPIGAPGSVAQEAEVPAALSGNPEVILMAGIQDISNTLVEDFKLNDVLRIIMETMYRAKGFKRVILCVRDARNNTMLGRFGFGADAPEVARCFNFPLTFTPDIFHAALSKGVDILERRRYPDLRHARRKNRDAHSGVVSQGDQRRNLRALSAVHQEQSGGADLRRQRKCWRNRHSREGTVAAAQSGGAGDQAVELSPQAPGKARPDSCLSVKTLASWR